MFAPCRSLFVRRPSRPNNCCVTVIWFEEMQGKYTNKPHLKYHRTVKAYKPQALPVTFLEAKLFLRAWGNTNCVETGREIVNH